MTQDADSEAESRISASETIDPVRTIARLLEVEINPVASTTIPLVVPTPCCVQTNGRICGRGTTTAIVTYNPNGTWLLIPICPACMHDIGVVYGHLPETM